MRQEEIDKIKALRPCEYGISATGDAAAANAACYAAAKADACAAANEATMAARIGELHSLHVAAFMDIEKTTESLKQILEYKKEAAKQMLRCSDEKQMDTFAGLIMQADDMIRKVLGMHVP